MDQVHITAVGNASNVPMWATQKTQDQILKAMQDHYTVSEKAAEDLRKSIEKIAKDGKKANDKNLDELNDIVKNLEKTDKRNTKSDGKKSRTPTNIKAGNFDCCDEIIKALNRMNGGKGGDKKEEKARKGFIESIKKNTAKVKELTKAMSSMMNSVRSAFSYLHSQIKDQSEVYLEVNRHGVNLGVSLSDFTGAAADAYMEIGAFGDVVKNNTLIMNKYGVKGFGKAAKTLTDDLALLGVSGKEGATYLAEYLDTQRMLGTFQEMDRRKSEQAAKRNLEVANDFAKVLGKSREEILAQSNASKKSAQSMLMLSTVPQEQKAAMQDLLGNVANLPDGMRTLAEQALLLGDAFYGTQEFADLAATGNRDVGYALVSLQKKLLDGSLTLEDINAAYAKSFDLNDLNELERTRIAYMQTSGAISQQASITAGELSVYNKANADKTQADKEFDEELRKIRKKELENLSRYNNAIQGIQTNFKSIIGSLFDDDMMAIISKTFKDINDILGGSEGQAFKESIGELIKSFVPAVQEMVKHGVPLFSDITKWMTDATSWLAGLQSLAKTIGVLIVGLIAFKAMPTLLGTLVTGVSSLLSGSVTLVGFLLKSVWKTITFVPKMLFKGIAGAGKLLLKMMPNFIKDAVEVFKFGAKSLGKSFAGLPKLLGKGIGTLLKKIPIIGNLITGSIGLYEVWGDIESESSIIDKIKIGLGGILTGIGEGILNLFTIPIDFIFGTDTTGWLSDQVGKARDLIKNFNISEQFEKIGDSLSGAFDYVKDKGVGLFGDVKDYFNNSELKEVMSNSGIVQGASGLFSSVTGLMDQARLVLYEKMSGLPLVGDKFAQMASDLQAEMDEKATEIKSTKKIQVDNSPLQPKFNVMGAPEQPIQFAQFGKTIPAPVAQQDLSEPPNSVMTSSETKQTVQNNGINTMTIERLLSMLIQEQQRGNNILKKLDTSVGFN